MPAPRIWDGKRSRWLPPDEELIVRRKAEAEGQEDVDGTRPRTPASGSPSPRDVLARVLALLRADDLVGAIRLLEETLKVSGDSVGPDAEGKISTRSKGLVRWNFSNPAWREAVDRLAKNAKPSAERRFLQLLDNELRRRR